MKIGYARISTNAQELRLQLEALRAAGCQKIYEDAGPGSRPKHPVLARLLKDLEPGDQLVVSRLDRLGYGLGKLVALIEQLGEQGIGFSSLHEHIDTASATGILQFRMFCALAEMQRSLASEKTKAGLAKALAKGKRLGRPHALTEPQITRARQAIAEGAELTDIAFKLGVHPRTLHRALMETPGDP